MTTPTQYDFVAGEWVVVADPHAPEPPPWHEDEQPVDVDAIEQADLEAMWMMADEDAEDSRLRHEEFLDGEWIRRGEF